MKDYFKQYWYVGLVSIVFLIGIVAVFTSSKQGVVSGKKVDGKDIVYSIGSINTTADEIYELVGSNYEVPLASLIFEREVLERTYDYTEDQKVEAKLEADQLIMYYKSMYGEEVAEKLIDQNLQAMGYPSESGLVNYYLNISASEQLVNDYFVTNYKESFINDEKPVIVSHILVSLSEDEDLSDEEKEALAKEQMDEIDELLKTEKFEDVAKEHSDDTGSAQNGGSLGLVYKSISFHPEFLDGLYELETNEVSDWILSPSGYHKILITSDKYSDIEASSSYSTVLETLYPQLKGEAFFQQAETLNFDFSMNPEFEQKLRQIYRLGDSE